MRQVDDETSADRDEDRFFSPHLLIYDGNELLTVEPQLLPEASSKIHTAIVSFRFNIYDVGRTHLYEFGAAVMNQDFFHRISKDSKKIIRD